MKSWVNKTMLWFSLHTMLPTFIIFYLPNNWYWIILKIILGLWAFGTMHSLLFKQWPEVNLGVAKVGFIINSILIAGMLIINYKPLYYVGAFLIITSYPFMREKIIEAQLLNRGGDWQDTN